MSDWTDKEQIMRIQNILLKLKTASSGAFSHPVRFLGFAGMAVVAPFLMLITGGKEPNQLPWSFWAIVPFAGLGIISVGFWRFMHEPSQAKSISISPNRKLDVWTGATMIQKNIHLRAPGSNPKLPGNRAESQEISGKTTHWSPLMELLRRWKYRHTSAIEPTADERLEIEAQVSNQLYPKRHIK
jgi:hypothetical protein